MAEFARMSFRVRLSTHQANKKECSNHNSNSGSSSTDQTESVGSGARHKGGKPATATSHLPPTSTGAGSAVVRADAIEDVQEQLRKSLERPADRPRRAPPPPTTARDAATALQRVARGNLTRRRTSAVATLEAEVRAPLCTDNRMVSSVTMTDEYRLAWEHFKLTPKEIRQTVLYGFKAAFVPYQRRRQLLLSAKQRLRELGLGGAWTRHQETALEERRAQQAGVSG